MSVPCRPHTRPAAVDRFWYGVCYYPDQWQQWDPAAMAEDAPRMAAAGMNLVRMAEFAWDLMEPQPGVYDFSCFDEAITRLAAHGIRTVLGTPTAAPPRWLTLAHPDLLRVDGNGKRMEHGSRQHVCQNHPRYREFSRAITTAMAEHFNRNPHVVGWQTDNEINCHFSDCHCASCQVEFPRYLRRRYRNDIGALNHAWGTAFWASTYRDFDEIPTPRSAAPTHVNPGHRLDYARFITDAAADYQADQVRILRATGGSRFIFHNGTFPSIDYHGRFSGDLDLLGYDVYPGFETTPSRRWLSQANGLDRTRAFSGNFIVPEQQSGGGGQSDYLLDTPEPGEMRQLAYASIARGADSLLFFRWRTARAGAEEYWHGILDHDNVPRRRYREAAQLGAELQRVGPAVIGSSVHVDCAIASAPLEVRAAHQAYHLGLPEVDEPGWHLHSWLVERSHAAGYVHPADDLSQLKLYLIPGWPAFDPAWVPGLERWVRAGGVLVIGPRTACRDLATNQVVKDTLPGCLRQLVGATVEEYGKQNCPDERPLTFRLGTAAVKSERWYELLQPDAGTEILASWEGRHLTGTAAATVRSLGQGQVVYVGTWLTTTVVAGLLPELVRRAGLRPQLPQLPAKVQVVQRRKAGRTLWFLLNHADAPVTIPQPPAGRDLIVDRDVRGPLTLEPYGVAAIQA